MTKLELPDPRGIAEQERFKPAPRLASLKGHRLLLVDNGKLAERYLALGTIGTALLELFEGYDWTTFSRDFLRYNHTQFAELADEIMALRPEAVVFAYADSGVGVQTTLVAAALEKSGIPTVILASHLGAPASAAIAATRVPELPIVAIDIVRGDSTETVKARLKAAKSDIETALTRERQISKGEPASGEILSFSPKSEGWLATHEFQDWLEANEMGDGLPLLAPLPQIVDSLLATVPANPDEVIYARALTSGRRLRVRDIAVNAAMTGCPPKAFPVVLAALRAMVAPDYRILLGSMTTHPAGNFVLLSGCEPEHFGLSGGPGCLGPGHRGNLSVGRAVSLSVRHLFGTRPGGADMTTFGSPAEIAYCMAEQTGKLPWPSLASENGFDGPAVLVLKVEAPRNVMEDSNVTTSGLCDAIVAGAVSQCSNNAYIPGDLAVLINPEHAKVFTDAGWSRADLAQAIHHRATLPRDLLEGRGLIPFRPPYMDALKNIPVTRSPADVYIAIGGAPGPHSCVALPWGSARGQWMAVSAR